MYYNSCLIVHYYITDVLLFTAPLVSGKSTTLVKKFAARPLQTTQNLKTILLVSNNRTTLAPSLVSTTIATLLESWRQQNLASALLSPNDSLLVRNSQPVLLVSNHV